MRGHHSDQGRCRRAAAALLLVALGLPALAAGCTDAEQERPVTVQPGAPGEPGEVVAPGGGRVRAEAAPHTAADVEFVQAMLPHHAQALVMTGYVADRTDDPEITLLARRIEISQQDEIVLMEDWLSARGEPVETDAHANHQYGAGEPVPGMLTLEQLIELERATGAEFDRRFLEYMIQHHEGALTMVRDLFARGGGAEAELFEIAGHIDADQRIEIGRMRDLLAERAAG